MPATSLPIANRCNFDNRFTCFGNLGSEAMMDVIGCRYVRTCFIFSNLSSVIRPGDRVVVLMGQGHVFLLRQFVRLNPNPVNVDPLRYLK